ncbi:NADPH-dependent F420 reductase [Klebsiella oxytoca]
MKISVIGTGMVGRAVAERLNGLGHDTVIGTRDPAATLARTEPDMKGTPAFSHWHAVHPHTKLVTMEDAGKFGDVIVNATSGSDAISALELVGKDNLAGKVVLDISLPLDLSEGLPPKLLVANDDSLGEQIQRAFPEARIVKSLNTVQFEIMMDPTLLPGTHNIFVSGNDINAKNTIQTLLKEFGWSTESIIDLGDITTSRAVEMYSRLLFTLAGKFGSYHFNIAIVRPQ